MVKPTLEPSELKEPYKTFLYKGVKVSFTSRPNKASDGDLLKIFVIALENYYNLMTISDPHQ